jgi:hypothetical protein
VGRPSQRATVYYTHPGGRGWDTVELLARLAAELLEADLSILDASRDYSRAYVARSLLPRRHSGGPALVIAPQPAHLNAALSAVALRRGHDAVFGWVIDSFWLDRIPRVVRTGHFDRIFITDAELVDAWASTTSTVTEWLPFGSDVLRRGSAAGDRDRDIQRVGRMPAPWDDDASNREAGAERGLRVGGRTPFFPDAESNQQCLMAAMAGAKFVLAFSNTAAPAEYTHPTHEYLTGRWTDALASGAVVAGIAPVCRATSDLLWPGALLELGTTDRDAGLAIIADAVREWTPQRACHNHRMALERLDWRWRLRTIADRFGLTTDTLSRELETVAQELSRS